MIAREGETGGFGQDELRGLRACKLDGFVRNEPGTHAITLKAWLCKEVRSKGWG